MCPLDSVETIRINEFPRPENIYFVRSYGTDQIKCKSHVCEQKDFSSVSHSVASAFGVAKIIVTWLVMIENIAHHRRPIPYRPDLALGV